MNELNSLHTTPTQVVTQSKEQKLETILKDYAVANIYANLNTAITAPINLTFLNYTIQENKLVKIIPSNKLMPTENYLQTTILKIANKYKSIASLNRTIPISDCSESDYRIRKHEEALIKKQIRNKIIKPYRLAHKSFVQTIKPEEIKKSVQYNETKQLNGILQAINRVKEKNYQTYQYSIKYKIFLQKLIELDPVAEPETLFSKIKKSTKILFENTNTKFKEMRRKYNQTEPSQEQNLIILEEFSASKNHIEIKNIDDLISNYNHMTLTEISKERLKLGIAVKQLYSQIDEQRQNGFEVKHSSKLIKYSKNNLREQIVQIYADSDSNKHTIKTVEDTLNTIREKLNIDINKSALYREINIYKKEKGLMQKIDRDIVLYRTNKNLLRKYTSTEYNSNQVAA